MDSPIVGGILAFAAGFAVSAVNYLISRSVRRRAADNASQTRAVMFPSLIRQAICLVFLVALYFLAPLTPWERSPLLIGGALGITLPPIFFTMLLLRDDASETEKEKSKKEENDDG